VQARADERGYFVEDAFDPATVARIVGGIAPFEAKSDAFLPKQPGGRFAIARADEITFTTHLVARSPFLREFCRHPVFCDLVHDLIGPDVRLYWDQAVYKKPGTRAPFPWHQDNGYTFVEPEAYLTCWVAPTRLERPGARESSRRTGRNAGPPTDSAICFSRDSRSTRRCARRIVVFRSLTPHATGPNPDRRRALPTSCTAPDGAARARRGGQPRDLRGARAAVSGAAGRSRGRGLS
jgi:hypothetical protein